MKGELSKLRDEMFVLSHELADVDKIKKTMFGLEGKLDKMKNDS